MVVIPPLDESVVIPKVLTFDLAIKSPCMSTLLLNVLNPTKVETPET